MAEKSLLERFERGKGGPELYITEDGPISLGELSLALDEIYLAARGARLMTENPGTEFDKSAQVLLVKLALDYIIEIQAALIIDIDMQGRSLWFGNGQLEMQEPLPHQATL